jgi:hypothetical protein
MKRGLLFGAVTFFLVVCFMIVNSDKLSPVSKDPAALAPPNAEFNEWRKLWEKQR